MIDFEEGKESGPVQYIQPYILMDHPVDGGGKE